jgi:hypothetical protein
MRVWVLLVLLLLASALVTLSLTCGQEHEAAGGPPPAAAVPGRGVPTAQRRTPATPSAATPAPTARDLAQLPPAQQPILLSANRGADWLFRMNGVKGHFVHGYLPALKRELEGDHFLRQAGAAFALARAARFFGEDRYTARAAQAVLALLEDTAPDPKDRSVRACVLPAAVVNRLGAAALLVLAINALPNPQADLLEKSEQLCNHIRRQARPDGSLAAGAEAAGAEEADDHAGAALFALARSHRHRPADWKLAMVRKALAYYRPWWRGHKKPASVAWLSAACAEAFLQTRQREFVDFVFEMNDWACGLQYAQIDPQRQHWFGGFMGYASDRAVESPPDVGGAVYAEGLAAACRAAREAGDPGRHARYTEALDRCWQFLSALQYTESNTLHFADWYRPRLLGAFHASHDDGNLRLDYTQHAVCALLLYLEDAARDRR